MSEAVREVPKKERPQFKNIHVFDLATYHWPIGAYVSILHRVSGCLMFVLLPFVLYLLQQSLRSEISFAYYQGIISYPLVKLILLAVIWAYLQHLCAGVRHLFMDLHIGITKTSVGKTAISVLVVSLSLTVIIALKLFGVF